MKVKELINSLKKANPDAEIIIATFFNEIWEIASIYTKKGTSREEINFQDKELFIDLENEDQFEDGI